MVSGRSAFAEATADKELRDVVFPEFCGGIEVSMAERRATAAAAVFYERNFESKRFEHFHGSNADVRFVITHKGVVPKDNFAAFPKERRCVTAGAIWRSPFLEFRRL